MAKTFTAQMTDWSNKAKRNIDLVAKAAAQSVFEDMTERQASITETGTFEIGKVPVDTGELVNSQIASLNGVAIASGAVDYTAVIVGMEMGDTVEGVFTAPHAAPMEYGFTAANGTQVPGRFFVREAIQNWPQHVAKAAAMFKD